MMKNIIKLERALQQIERGKPGGMLDMEDVMMLAKAGSRRVDVLAHRLMSRRARALLDEAQQEVEEAITLLAATRTPKPWDGLSVFSEFRAHAEQVFQRYEQDERAAWDGDIDDLLDRATWE